MIKTLIVLTYVVDSKKRTMIFFLKASKIVNFNKTKSFIVSNLNASRFYGFSYD